MTASTSLLSKCSHYLEAIKFSHTVFAMPFAIIATLLAAEGKFPSWEKLTFIVLAMIGARTWAMGVNRIADAAIDAQNPRTAMRAIPSKALSEKGMMLFSFLGAALFVISAALLSRVALYCSVPLLLILASYSYTKRFTWLCHFWLGFCLGLAPMGAWVALRETLNPDMLALTFAITFWVGGFDILYALQDEEFDKKAGLHSIPARFGSHMSQRIAIFSHILAAAGFLYFGAAFQLTWPYFLGVCACITFMIYEHTLIAKKGLSHIQMAFFSLNGWIAVTLLSATCVSLLL